MPGLRAIYGSVIVAGIFAFLVAPFFARLIRLFPPIVTGTVITIIGIVLLSVAALDAGGGGASQFTDPPTFGALRNLALAGFTLLIILAIYRMFTGFVATIAVLIGLVVGTLAGWLFDFTDFSRVAGADVLGVTTPFHFGAPDLQRGRGHLDGHRHADHHGRDHRRRVRLRRDRRASRSTRRTWPGRCGPTAWPPPSAASSTPSPTPASPRTSGWSG